MGTASGVSIDHSAWVTLQEKALEAASHAYAPYSGFSVGAAVLTSAGDVFSGCNVENASYGLTICAERNAIFSAVTGSRQKPQIIAIYVVSEPVVPAAPCGACRQVLSEFGLDAQVSFEGPDGRVEKTVRDLLPDTFELVVARDS